MINPLSATIWTTKATLISIGVYKAIEWTNDIGSWVGGFFPKNEAKLAVHKIGVATLVNYTGISGLGHAIYSCPWPWQEGSGACYRAGLNRNPIAQTVTTVLAPLNFAIKVGSCSTKAKGPTGMAACVLDLDDEGKRDLEEKAEVIGLFAGLALIWYLTLPKEGKEKKKARPA